MAMARATSGPAYPERFYAAASYAGFDGSESSAKNVSSKFSNDTALLLYALYQQVKTLLFPSISNLTIVDFTRSGGFLRLIHRFTERETSLDLPPARISRRKNVNEPVVAFGPPGSTGELNVSVIVSPVSPTFSIEAFGGPKEVGEAIVKTVTRSGQRTDLKGTLLEANLRQDSERNLKYYELEFKVESPSFRRHNVAVCCANGGRLYTLNAQAPESAWSELKHEFHTIAKSFNIIS
ncbi:hypothetical protein F2Q70_00023960 [Brassica cretica]|uniref:PsbP C-terminal domain-containing protein n=1 Tax=Brassica cretica TaxID=69181 RepID=A0A8S9GNR2_BRACR|nr:hypothetical protein F2Q70_00023960 [Brassica cretica]